jgi:hypothetical protein
LLTTTVRRLLGKIGGGRALARLRKLYRWMRIVRRSPYDNIYHCCTQKTASQWLRAVFSDPIVYRYTGLTVFPYTQIMDQLQDASFDELLPRRTIDTNLYIGHPTYLRIRKPQKYRTFFILRDPRDIVVSWYFSTKYSHPLIGGIAERRRDLANLSLQDGLRYAIDTLHDAGLFMIQRTWLDVPNDEENVAIFKYEDLATSNSAFLGALFPYLGIDLPERMSRWLCRRHAFAVHSGGRQQNVEDKRSHYRKGVPGDWVDYFDSDTMAHFKKVTTDLVDVLGYAADG